MTLFSKVGRNDACPCGSRDKYKNCCLDTVDWNRLRKEPEDVAISHLSARGKNLLFLGLLADALQLDTLGPPRAWVDFKRAFTASAVRRIFEAVAKVWPSAADLDRVLKLQRRRTSGLYVGTYEPNAILKGVTRHVLYADSITLIDPFVDPRVIRDKYNPLLHPAMHQSSALKWATMWFSLAPWIEAGLVDFVRSPGTFDVDLELETWRLTEARYTDSDELMKLADETAAQMATELGPAMQLSLMLAMPDDALRAILKEGNPGMSEGQAEAALKCVQRLRDEDPHLVAPLDTEGGSQLMMQSSGSNYEMAKRIALRTGSFIVTDLPARWREMAMDRDAGGVDPQRWSPFAKAFQGVPFHFLNNVPLPAALSLREEGHLENLRALLRKSWRASASGEPYDEANATELAAELQQRINEAEAEWRKIDRELLRWAGTEFAAGVLAAGPAIALGGAEWAAAALVIAGAANLVVARGKRKEHALKYPAGFFLKLRRQA